MASEQIKRELRDKVAALRAARFGGDHEAAFGHYAGGRDGTIDKDKLKALLGDAGVGLYYRQHYVTFGRGQIRYVLEVGDGEVAMPAEGTVVEKKRVDMFRHRVLGVGAGDLVVRSGGQNGPPIKLKNVLHIRRKLAVINKLLREKGVTVD